MQYKTQFSNLQNQFFMDRRITARLNMANAVKELCAINPGALTMVPAFAALVTLLNDKIMAINAVMLRLSSKSTALATDKTEWKARLSLLLSVVCGAGVSYSRKIKDVVLEGNFGYVESELFQLRDTELIQVANSIIELQASVAAQLVDYGITTAFMDDVQDALDKFVEKNPKPIVNVYTSEVDRSELLSLAYDLSDFVLNDMMQAAKIFKLLKPGFYQSLENASRIRSAGLRHEVPANSEALGGDEAQDATTASELLGSNVEAMNASTETPAVPVPSSNGVG